MLYLVSSLKSEAAFPFISEDFQFRVLIGETKKIKLFNFLSYQKYFQKTVQRKEKYRMPSYNNNNLFLNCTAKWRTKRCGKTADLTQWVNKQKLLLWFTRAAGFSLACSTDEKAQTVRIQMHRQWEDSTNRFTFNRKVHASYCQGGNNSHKWIIMATDDDEIQNLGFCLKNITLPTKILSKNAAIFLFTWKEIVHSSCETSKQRQALKRSVQVFHGVQWILEWVCCYSQQWDTNQQLTSPALSLNGLE